jgi:hypothetical protein
VIRLRSSEQTKVPHDLRAFACWLNKVLDIRHEVTVYICSRLYGFFDAPRLSADAPSVFMGLDDDYMDTLAHEVVHYEQWRDRREISERGVERRARALVRQWRREAA